MKKSFLYTLGLIALLVFSCTDEEFVEQSGNGLRITGSLAQDSRTTFVEDDGVIETHWEIGDSIALYTDGDLQNNLKYKAKISGKTTEFEQGGDIELQNVEGKTVYACYPFNFWVEGYAKTHSIPSTNYLYGSTLDTHFLYGEGKISNNQLNLSFKHYFSYLRLKISVQEIKDWFARFLEQPWTGEESEYDLTKTYLMIRSSEDIGLQQATFNPRTHEVTQKIAHKYFRLYLDNIDFSSDNTYTYMVPILPQPGGSSISVEIWFTRNGSGEHGPTFEKTVSENGLKVGHAYNWGFANMDTNEELFEWLKTLYEKTGGEYWTSKTNWLSEKPVEEWMGVVLNAYGKLDGIWLQNNNLVGEFPEVLVDIMNDASNVNLNLNYNRLYGEIPESLKNHSRWSDWGWSIIAQKPYGEPVVQNYNLYAPNVEVEHLIEDESMESNLHEIIQKNKLTQIIKGYDNTYKPNSTFIINELSKNRVNLHLDYQSKGLGTVIFVGDGTDEELQNLKNEILSVYGNIDGIHWLKGKSPITGADYYSSSYVFDSNAQLVYYAYYHAPTTITELNIISMSRNNYAKALKTVLGEPAEHPDFTPSFYTSTDYSKNGEVVTLQEATVGTGINLIFLGDGFVDKDMDTGGYYEEFMKKAMENFFSMEPYKTFRNRFNVYTVKVVSPNDVWVEGAEHVLNNGNYWDYAIKAPYKAPMMATVFLNPKHGIINQDRSKCYMSDTGSFVSYIRTDGSKGGTSLHETGGHGIAGLWDEYVEEEYGEKTLPDNLKTYLDNVWTSYGQGANVDWRNDASTVKWAHFLKDERYANEGLGIYEGAYLYGYGAYRPTENSIMRYDDMVGVQFNAPSREQIYKRIMQYSEGDSWTYDYEKFVEYDAINRTTAARSAVKSMTEAERQEYLKQHCPPVFVKGTMPDAMKNEKSNIIVPLR